ncbi:MAG: DNA topoisomerase I, partial [Planctomycetaceae bacterium]|nr:DNA topoisomerase I [Planctomycetaceae bacterium]
MPAPTNFISWFLKPISRFVVGLIAIPMLRSIRRRIPRLREWDDEFEKDIEQWFRGSLLLLAATKNAEVWLMHLVNAWLEVRAGEELAAEIDLNRWWITAGRLLLAIGVVESMPDQELFSIIHPGPKWTYDRSKSFRDNVRREFRPICRGMVCQHLNRSSPVFAILAVIFGGIQGWIFYLLAIAQYLIIGLVTSRDRALDVLSQFDRAVAERRQEIIDEFEIGPQPVGEESPPQAAV